MRGRSPAAAARSPEYPAPRVRLFYRYDIPVVG